jgi:hypothetical protein
VQPTTSDPRIARVLLPMLARSVRQALHELTLARAHLQAQGTPEAALWQLRLAPDMLCLAHQVQVLCDGVCGELAQLRGDLADPCAGQVFNRGESDLPPPLHRGAELAARLQQTLDALAQAAPETLQHLHLHPSQPVQVERPGVLRRFGSEDFLWGLVLPNVLFHATLIHALLRHGGVPLGKDDFMGPSPWPAPWTGG